MKLIIYGLLLWIFSVLAENVTNEKQAEKQAEYVKEIGKMHSKAESIRKFIANENSFLRRRNPKRIKEFRKKYRNLLIQIYGHCRDETLSEEYVL